MRIGVATQMQPLSNREGGGAICRKPGNLPNAWYRKRIFPDHEGLIVPQRLSGVFFVRSLFAVSVKSFFMWFSPEKRETRGGFS